MKLRTKIFLFASLLVIIITITGFYILNSSFTKTISETIQQNFRDSRFVFEQIISFSENELNLRAQVLADQPKLKAAISTRDEPTISRELDVLAQSGNMPELLIVANRNNQVLSYKLLTPDLQERDYSSQLETLISNMSSLNDFWDIEDNLFQIAAYQIMIRSGDSAEGYFVILGDRFEDSVAFAFKEMTRIEINIGAKMLCASTFAPNPAPEFPGPRYDALKAIQLFRTNNLDQVEQAIDSTMYFVDMDGVDHIAQFGEIAGQAGASFMLSIPRDRELKILSSLREIQLILGVASVILVFLISFISAKKITNPLSRLTKGAQAIGAGDLENKMLSKLNNGKSSDEIDILADNFEIMRCGLKDNIEKITQLNTELSGKNVDLENALDELKRTQEELIMSERMSTVGKMASGIIHDFKSPMQVILGMADLMGMQNVDETKKQDIVNSIKNAVKRMNGMTLELLEYVRGEANLNLEPVKISEVINELLLYLSSDLQTNDFKVSRVITDDPVIEMDASKMKRVFENIIRNAIEAASGDNMLKIEARRFADGVEIEISDSGSGIPEEIRETLFKPFVTHGKKSGSGLGLAITKKFVDDHNGSIEVESEVGMGTSFIIKLPAHQ